MLHATTVCCVGIVSVYNMDTMYTTLVDQGAAPPASPPHPPMAAAL